MIKREKKLFKNCAILFALFFAVNAIPTSVLAVENTSDIEQLNLNEESSLNNDNSYTTVNSNIDSLPAMVSESTITDSIKSINKLNSKEGLKIDTLNSSSANINYSVEGNAIVGNTITISINANSVSSLYGASIDFLYDTSLLQIESVSQGSLFAGKISKPLISNIDNGQVNIAMSLTGAATSISGSGSIATIKAKILKEGTISLKTTNEYSKLSLDNYTTCIKLSNSNGDRIGYGYVDKGINTLKLKELDCEIIENNIPDSMEAGKTYSATIKVKNTGYDTWTKNSNIKLGITSGNSTFGTDTRILLNDTDSVATGEIATFTFNLTAPYAGKYNFNVRMLKEEVAWFGNSSSKSISVTAKNLDAQILENNIPASMDAGKTYSATIKVKNIGADTWTKDTDIKLGITSGNSNFGTATRILLGDTDSVAPGEIATFTFNLTAPYAGKYNFAVKMLKEGVAWFGDSNSKEISISAKNLDAQILENNIPASMDAGKTYSATVKVKNVGADTWTKDTDIKLGITNGNSTFGTATRILLGDTDSVAPGEIATFTFNLTAPSSGTYNFAIRMVKEGVAWFGDAISKSISVSTTNLNAQILENNIPASMDAGKTYSATIKVKNIGTDTWTKNSNIKLGITEGNSTFGTATRILLGDKDSIAPNETATFTFNITAPSSGTYNFTARMLKEGVAWFGNTSSKSISVSTTNLNAQILENNIPTSMEPGKTYSATIKVKNIGTDTWTKATNIKLGVTSGNSTFGTATRILLEDSDSIAPGEVATFSVKLIAPSASGSYNFTVRMLQEAVAWFGTSSSKNIVVSGNDLDAQILENNIPTSMEPGKVYSATIKVKNTGTTNWTKDTDIKLGVTSGNSIFGVATRILLNDSDSIAPGEIATFSVQLTAPTSGSYNFTVRMLKEAVAWFGTSSSKNIVVNGNDLDAQILENSIPTSMEAGKVYSATIKVKNTGTTNWTKDTNIKLGITSGNSIFAVPTRILLNDSDSIAPGEVATFTFNLTAPTSGSYNFTVRMLKEAVTWFGTTSNRSITVK